MRITRPNTLIPYLTAYLINHFYDSETTFDLQKPIVDLKSTSKNVTMKRILKINKRN